MNKIFLFFMIPCMVILFIKWYYQAPPFSTPTSSQTDNIINFEVTNGDSNTCVNQMAFTNHSVTVKQLNQENIYTETFNVADVWRVDQGQFCAILNIEPYIIQMQNQVIVSNIYQYGCKLLIDQFEHSGVIILAYQHYPIMDSDKHIISIHCIKQ